MSDTLADLSSWLPSDFLSGNVHDNIIFPNNIPLFPYDFTSSSSTESESDDDDVTGLTRHFTRSLSLQERLKTPFHSHLQMVFSGSYPTTPFGQTEEDALDRIYASAGQVARMKMMLMNNANDDVYATRGLLGPPYPVGTRPTPHSHSQHHPNCAVWTNERQDFIRQQHLRRTLSGVPNYVGRPVALRQSAWPSLPVENQRHQQHANGFVVKPVVAGSDGRRNVAVKKECAGTGVFLPRNFSKRPPEIKKKSACSPAHPPARMAQAFNKNMVPINLQQQNIHAGFPPHCKYLKRDEVAEIVMARRNALMLAQQRRSIPETPLGPPEVVLPQEWTY